jgi:peptidoglycan-associated lipoprotein
MFQPQRTLLLSWSLLVPVVLIGCGPLNPSTVNRSTESTRPYWSIENPLASTGASQGQSQRLARDTTSPSSLDALRRGQSPATPASSPMKDIQFDFDSYALRTDAQGTLRATAEWLKANPSVRVEIEGHCDERGTDEYNLALGAKRAQAAKDYLVKLGVAAARLSTISYGEEIPVCREQTEACWEKNRRDRFVIIPLRPAS